MSHDTQTCHQCLASQYILDPNQTSCQDCPPGLSCSGHDLVLPVVTGSQWQQAGSVYQLILCPTGYMKMSALNGTTAPANQRCQPCAEGSECVLDVCDVCTDCQPGTYKDVAGTQRCRACSQNTYNAGDFLFLLFHCALQKKGPNLVIPSPPDQNCRHGGQRRSQLPKVPIGRRYPWRGRTDLSFCLPMWYTTLPH